MAKVNLDKMKEKRDALAARIRTEEAKLKARGRKSDTRRKVLAGATVLYHAEKDSSFNEALSRMLDGFLVRAEDRALFGLTAKGESKKQSGQ
jgi:hypothetical protein